MKNYRIDDKKLSEQEFKNFVFGTGKVVSVNDPTFLLCALEVGEYVIGASYNPFALQVVYHYENDTFQVFHFAPGCHQEPLDIELEFEGDNMLIEDAIELIYSFGQHDDLLINPTKDMLNLDNINK